MARYSKKFSTGIGKSDSVQSQLENTISELKMLGYRERTLYDYRYHVEKYIEVTGVTSISDMDKPSLLKYINHNQVAQSTKRIRLKLMKAILNRWYSEGLIPENFWKDITVKVDESVKEGIIESELELLINSLDFTDFVELRDGSIFLLIWETGVRVGTINRVTEDMVDLTHKLVNFGGDTMKNHQSLSLPISDRLTKMLMILVRVNDEVRKHNGVYNRNLFISSLGNPINSKSFGKRVVKYKQSTGLKNINPHAIRRGFARRLLDNEVSIPVISKALNHKSIETTTKYLYVDNQEIIDILRDLQ